LTDTEDKGSVPEMAHREMATTSKEGSRHVTYPMFNRRKTKNFLIFFQNEVVTVHINIFVLKMNKNDLNEYNVNDLTRINWRASLVPAAAVIPAPIAYIIVVAVKKFVVGF